MLRTLTDPNRRTVRLSFVSVILVAMSVGTVAAQSATVSSEDVTLANQGDSGNSSITIEATEGVGGVDAVVSVDTSVGEITEARETQTGMDYDGGIDVAPDGSNATITYTDIQGSQSDFEVAELELQSNTPNVDSTPIALSSLRVINVSGGDLSVTEDEGTLSTGAQANPEFSGVGQAGNLIDIAGQGADATIETGENEDVSVNVTNTGDAGGDFSVDLEIEDSTGTTELQQTQTTSVLAPGESEELVFSGVTGNLDADDYTVTASVDGESVTGDLTVTDPLGDAARIEGDIADQESRIIDNAEEIEIRVTGDSQAGNEFLNFTTEFQNFDSLEQNNPLVERADYFDQGEGPVGGDDFDRYILELATVGDSDYTINPTLEGFTGFGPFLSPLGPGEVTSDASIRLERFVNADDIEIDKTPAGGTVDLDGTINDDVTVFTEDDSRGGGIGQLAPLSNTPVDVTIVDSNTGDINGVTDGDLNITPTTPENTDANGIIEFDFGLDMGSIDESEINADVNFALEFEATDSGTDGPEISQTQNITFTNELFKEPLINRFDSPAQNIPADDPQGLDDTLYEDLDGDGSGTDVDQTVAVFGELIRGNDLGLTDEQARALNWNQGSPETEVTSADMVSLFGRQIRAD